MSETLALDAAWIFAVFLVVVVLAAAAIAGRRILLDRGGGTVECGLRRPGGTWRLGVAAYGWWNEAAHGVSCESLTNNQNCTNLTNTTSYPVALSLASSWDPALIHDEASLISDEAREVETNNTQNMDFYAPVINLMQALQKSLALSKSVPSAKKAPAAKSSGRKTAPKKRAVKVA